MEFEPESLTSYEELTATNDSLSESTKDVVKTEVDKGPLWKRLLWATLAVFLFLLFLIMKLPESRIQNLVLTYIKAETQNFGYSFQSKKVSLGVFLGPSIKFYENEIKSFENETDSIKIDYLKVRPHLHTLLPFIPVKKASLSAELLGGDISGVLGYGPGQYVVNLDMNSLALEKAPLLLKSIPVQIGSLKIEGLIDLRIEPANPKRNNGEVKLVLKNFTLPAQSLYGFNIPKIVINESQVNIRVTEGKILFQKFELGTDPKKDDISARITGEGYFDRPNNYDPLDAIKLNTKAVLQLSPTVLKSFPFIETFIGNGKISEGRYNFKITGSLVAPIFNPDASGN